MGLYNVINRALLQSGQPEDVSQVVANLDAVAGVLNGGIDPANLRGAPALSTGEPPVFDGSGFAKASVTKISPASLGSGSPSTLTYLRGDSSWQIFSGSGVDYKGTWDPATQYLGGDVVNYNGIDYVAVNASLNQVPSGAYPTGPTITYATGPPANPRDGDLWILPVDTTNGVMWQFRYRAASASAYKWEFVGGSDFTQGPGGALTTSSTTPVDLTSGPSITVPRAGDYKIFYGCRCQALASALCDYSVSAWSGGNLGGFVVVTGPASPVNISATGSSMVVATLAAGAVVNLRVATTVSGNGAFSLGILSIAPRRVQ